MKRCLTFALLLVLAVMAWGQRLIDREEILRDPEWRSVHEAYAPDPDLIASLRSLASQVRIDVYLGLWCGDSRDHVPVFLKIMDALASPGLKAAYYAVERKSSPEQKHYAPEAGVERVPTFIVLTPDGKEKGRIVETPKISILEDLLAFFIQ